jgi:MFS family permease
LPSPPPEPRPARPAPGPDHRPARRQLAFAAAAVLLAAADTYVVVAVLPSIMGGVGLGIDRLQRATPIISGFLLGYTIVLPLLGRLSDEVGRGPVFIGCLTAFGVGSLVTATAHDIGVLVAGRALQGLGGGGLVPVTLALVAGQWPPETRGLPLGVVGAVQELGSVVGPLYGAALTAAWTWRAIFWINLPVAAAVGIGFALARPRPAAGGEVADGTSAAAGARRARRDVPGPTLLGVGLLAAGLGLAAPSWLTSSVAWGWLTVPWLGGQAWAELSSPLTVIGAGLVLAGLVWEAAAPRSVAVVLPLRRIPAALRRVDLVGALLVAVTLACVVVLFSTEDPSRQVVASAVPVLAPVGGAALLAFVLWQRRSPDPLIPSRVLAPRPAWGSLVVNLALGAALMAALVDVPLFALTTAENGSQLGAAAVLARFLVAVPVGAVLGGALCRRPARGPVVVAAGALLAGAMFALMAGWDASALTSPWHLAGTSLGVGTTDLELALCGLGFGLTIAPVNAAILAAVDERDHGLASSLVVVARTVGMLAGLSALTAIGLHRFYQAQARIGSPLTLCPGHPASCPAYDRATIGAVLTELHTIYAGAAACALLAAVVAIGLLRARSTSSNRTTGTSRIVATKGVSTTPAAGR